MHINTKGRRIIAGILATALAVGGAVTMFPSPASAVDVTDSVTTIPAVSTVTRELISGIPNNANACSYVPGGGSDAKFAVKVDSPVSGQAYPIAPGITATVVDLPNSAGYSITISGGVMADVLIKAGPTYNSWYHFDPSVSYASPLFAPDNKQISHLTFCVDEDPPARLTLQKFSEGTEGDAVNFHFNGGLLGLFDLLGDGTPLVFDNLEPGGYVVGEINLPDGWNAGTSSCTNGQSPSALTLVSGDDVTCTFNNVQERGAVLVHKERKHAAAGSGDHPHEGVEFTVTNDGTSISEVITTDADGYACVDGLAVSALLGDYTVTETVPAGYSAVDAVQDVTVVEGDCETAAPASAVEFDNIPLTNVRIEVDSQVDGGTSSIINCGGDDVVTDADGDGFIQTDDLLPTAPDVSITCTVIIDP